MATIAISLQPVAFLLSGHLFWLKPGLRLCSAIDWLALMNGFRNQMRNYSIADLSDESLEIKALSQITSFLNGTVSWPSA
jgi:hypothetical protein